MGHSTKSTTDTITRLLPAGPEAVAQAARVLAAGGLAAFPTETVYGLGADATCGEAVAKIYEAKARPSFNPLISHVASLEAAQAQGIFDARALALANAYWPGPLTLVVPAGARCTVSALARAGLDSLALRVPAHPLAQGILQAFGKPVAAPSANRSGRISPTTAQHVMQELAGRCDLVVDGGPCSVGLESTIVACLDENALLLRPGGLARAEIERVLGGPLATPHAGGKVSAPGMLESHYAPRAALRLAAHDIRAGEAALDFAGRLGALAPAAKLYLDLSPRGDMREAAANLFGYMRQLDASGASRIAVAPIPPDGLGEAVNDRLTRAAAPRA